MKGVFFANLVLNLLNANELWMVLLTQNNGPLVFGIEVPQGNGYNRPYLGLNAFAPPVAGSSYNLNQIVFGPATADWAGGDAVTSFGFADSPVVGAGNLWILNDFDLPQQLPILNGQQRIYEPGDLILVEV